MEGQSWQSWGKIRHTSHPEMDLVRDYLGAQYFRPEEVLEVQELSMRRDQGEEDLMRASGECQRPWDYQDMNYLERFLL